MTRLWEATTYTDAPLAGCWWAVDTPTPTCPPLTSDTHADVAIIGAGFTGLNAALALARSGLGVTVLDENQPYWGASGRNGGFCCLGGSKLSGSAIRTRYGEDGLADWRQAERGAIDHVAALLQEHDIDADTHSKGETLLAHRPRDVASLKAEADSIRAAYGLTAEVLPKDALAEHGMSGPFHGAVTTPLGFALNPRKYASGLARAAAAAGAVLHGTSKVTAIEGRGPYRLITREGVLTADKLIVATNGYSSNTVPAWLGPRTMPLQSAVIVTRPMRDEELDAQGWTSHQMCHDTRHLLHYFRLMPDKRMLFGMRGGLSQRPGEVARNRVAIRAHFERMFPAWAHVETPHYWSGLLCASRDTTPYAGPIPDMPGAFTAFAYHGNGVAMGSWCGRLLADLVQGKAPALYPDVLRKLPAAFPFPKLRRAYMRPAYMLWGLQDL